MSYYLKWQQLCLSIRRKSLIPRVYMLLIGCLKPKIHNLFRTRMISIPNFLSLMRFPLALVFLQENRLYRIIAIILALITDGLDGFIARRYKTANRLGTL